LRRGPQPRLPISPVRLDLSGAIFRAARINKTKFAGAKLDRAILDQAWLLEADFTAASLKGANPFAA
jgi:uncharacterized protein YjbI with pentapeptide repeats